MALKEFRLPDLGEGLTEAEIVRWLVKEGDTVEVNQPLVEVETEKALVELPSPFAGTVERLHGEEGAEVKVGEILVSIRTSDEDEPEPKVLVGYGPEEEPATGRRRRRRASVATTATSSDEERIPVRAIRRAIAEKMVRSVSRIPHVTEWITVDATELVALRARLQEATEAAGSKLSPLPIVVKALLAALPDHPLLNSAWDDETDEIVVRRVYHVGVATDTDRGLLVPVVRGADRLTIFELAREIGRLVTAARDGSIGPAELTGSTITVSNVGSFGMEAGTPIINHPECAILALGVISKRPWVVEDAVEARDVMTLCVSFDHRIVDGAEAGRFLRHVADLVEDPAQLAGGA